MNPIKLFRILAIRVSFKEKTSMLLTNSFPKEGRSNAPIIFSRVDFPLPDGPVMATNSPLFTLKLILLRAISLPAPESKTLEIFSTLRANELSFLPFLSIVSATVNCR